MKKCSRCNELKVLTDFGIDKSRKDGLQIFCKPCNAERAKHYRNLNPDTYRKNTIKYKNSEKYQKVKNEYKEISKIKNKKHYIKLKEENPEILSAHRKKWKESEGYKNAQKKYQRKHRAKLNQKNKERICKYTDEQKLMYRIRRTIGLSLTKMNFTKNSRTYKILGCDVVFFKKYIESKFLNGMTWQNYGAKGWHFDHIIPISKAKNLSEAIKLNHYTNFQPLWWQDNLKKSNKLDYQLQNNV